LNISAKCHRNRSL